MFLEVHCFAAAPDLLNDSLRQRPGPERQFSLIEEWVGWWEERAPEVRGETVQSLQPKESLCASKS